MQDLELIYMLISITFVFSNWLDMSCEAQAALKSNPWLNHVVNILEIYFTIIVLTRVSPPLPSYAILGAVLMYGVFLLATKASFWFVFGSIMCLVVAMYCESNKLFIRSQPGELDKAAIARFEEKQRTMHTVSIALILAGVVIYALQGNKLTADAFLSSIPAKCPTIA